MAESIREQIEEIIAERKKNLPIVQEQYAFVQSNVAHVQRVIERIDELLQFRSKIDEELARELDERRGELASILGDYEGIITDLGNLEARFNRSTINIGVSGEARVGKSTTLQSFSGLTDTQIPTGTGLPVTAVRSEIFNAPESYAIVEFRDTESFINEYIKPLVENVNGVDGQHVIIENIAQLRAISLPETLGDNIGTAASKSLVYLKEAQESLGTYASMLSGATERKSIDDIRKFVAYPTDEEKTAGGTVNRAYLAVKSAKIYSEFPSLDGEMVGLIDLPGLGEIGKSAESIHTSGLENNVDQILLIMRPTSSSGFVGAGISNNIDQLRSIQPGISRRGDLIVAAINNDDTNSETSKTLRRDFESAINSSQRTDKIEVRDFCAIDEASVRELFLYLLEKLAKALPGMDRDAYRYVMEQGVGSIDQAYSNALADVSRLANQIIKTIPLEDSYLDELADELSRTLIYEYDEIEERRYADAQRPNPLRNKLEQQVTEIFNVNERRIGNGLFLASEAAWTKHAKGQPDYVNFLRSEAKRVRAEIVDSYRDVDVFYDYAIQELKSEVLSVFYGSTGSFYEKVGVNPDDATSSEDIERLVGELDAITRNEEFTHCFRFISEVSFKFSQNVFYNIYTSLEELHNPDANQDLGGRGRSGEEKIEMVRNDLKAMAREGNGEIKKRILEYNDRFNIFLYTCMTFFNDFLYRKDTKTYERCIRALLKGCREYIVPDEEYQADRDLQKATKRLREAVASQNGSLPAPEKQVIERRRPKDAARYEVAANPKPEQRRQVESQKEEAQSQRTQEPEKTPATKANTPEQKAVVPGKKPAEQAKTNENKANNYTSSYGQEW